MKKYLQKQFNKFAKWWLERQAPPGEFLAYINEQEAKLLKDNGGAGEKWGLTGIKSYFLKKFFRRIKKFFKKIIGAIGSLFKGIFGGLTPDIPSYDGGDGSGVSESIDGVKLTKKGTNVGIPVVYGFRRLGGIILFAESNSNTTYQDANKDTQNLYNRYLYVVYAIAEGEIEQVRQILVDDVKLPNKNPSFNTVHNVSSGRFKDRMQFVLYAGTEAGAQSELLNSTGWSNAQRKLPGVAYAVFRFEWKAIANAEAASTNPYTGSIPRVSFDVLGKKVFDVRTHSSGADLSTTYANLTKSKNSYNPVNHLLDYLLNPRFGAGLAITDIDADSFKTAAHKCAQQITYDRNGTQSGDALNGSSVLGTNAKILNNVKQLAQTCRGFMPYTQGRFKIKIEDGGHPTLIDSATVSVVYDVTNDEMIDDISMKGEDKANKYNQVIVRYCDPDRDFTEQEAIFPAETDSRYTTALAEDNGEPLIGQFQFPGLRNRLMAENTARMLFFKSRSQRFLQFSTTPQLLEAEVGDIIRVTNDTLGLDQQTFRITQMTINPIGTISISAREHDATIYPWVVGDQIENPPDTFLPNDYVRNPVAKNKPDVPVSVTPPNPDNPSETDSAGDEQVGGSPDNPNETPPDDEDKKFDNKVTQFSANIDANLFGAVTTASVTGHNAQIYSFPCNYKNYGGGTVEFRINVPTDSTLEKLRVRKRQLSTGNIIDETDYQLVHTATAPQGIVIRNVDQDTFLEFLYVKANNQLFIDGSTGAYNTQSFVGVDGKVKSGKDLEAVVNSHLQGSARSQLPVVSAARLQALKQFINKHDLSEVLGA